MLRQAKLALFAVADAIGVNKLILESSWRKQRLLVLCYHGVSIEDEHEWNPELYIPAELLRQRLEELKRLRMNVLPLGEAIERLKAGTLPARSAAITFDDGNYDFYKVSWPVLSEFNFPVTVYYTTYYAEYNRPVFTVGLSYLAWKGKAASTPNLEEIMAKGLDAGQKDDLLRNFSAELRIDYDAFCAKRLLQIMTLAEAAELAKQGVDFQLHTHRHRVSKNREKFLKEIDDNRTRLGQVTATKEATHFCYPGGYYRAEFPGWLAGHGVVSATTCNAGIAGPESQMHLLPRFIDTMYAPPVEFRSWLSGLAALLPHRAHVMSDGQLMEEWEKE